MDNEKILHTFTKFKMACYEAYKLDWMISHGFTLQDYLKQVSEIEEVDRANDTYPEGSTYDYLESANCDFEQTGFNGECWACFDEFLNTEFEDTNYMNHLIEMMPNTDALKEIYRKHFPKIRYV